MSIKERLGELGIELPGASPPLANYMPTVRTGNLVFTSGHGPRKPEGGLVTGRLGETLSVEEGYEAAKLTALACLGSLQAELGDLERVTRVVKLLVMVNCTPQFSQQPAVANGASDLLVAIFGDAGRHARSAVGMQSLPGGMAVEIEMVVEVA